MTSVDRGASFDVAAKHLFRHLHDARALRANPIVSRFFKVACTSLERAHNDREALSRIHEFIREGAAYCYNSDVNAGKEERAGRQHAIIITQCLEQTSIADVAQRLGISYYHCYRERATICRRVARYIVEQSRSSLTDYHPQLDEFRLLVDHARNRAVYIGERAAIRTCDDLVTAAQSPLQKLEALRVGTLVSIQYGFPQWAEQAYRMAANVFSEELSTAGLAVSGVGQAYLDLLAYTLARYHGNDDEAFGLTRHAALELEPHHARASVSVKELYTETLAYLSAVYWSLGKIDEGYDCLARAEASLQDVPTISFPFRVRVMTGVWKLRNYLSISCKSWYPPWQRLNGLRSAFDQAYASGLLPEAIEALVVATEHCAFGGNDDEALRMARLALTLARQQRSTFLLVQTTIEIAARMLRTRHWKYGSSLLASIRKPKALDRYHRVLLTYAYAEEALKLGRFGDAWALGNDHSLQEPLSTLSVRGQIVAAAAASRLQRRREARSLIDRVIATAEELQLTPILRDAYDVAGEVTGDTRFTTKAREVRRLLSG